MLLFLFDLICTRIVPTEFTSCEVFQRVTEHEHYSFSMRNTISKGKVTNTFANEDKTTVDAPTSRTWLALCSRSHPAWASEDTLVVPCKDTTVHQCPHSGEAVGGPQHAPRDSTTSTRPRLSRHALVTNKLYDKIQKRSPSFFAVSQIHYSFIFLLLKSRMLIVLTISALQHLSQEDPHWTSKIFQDIKPAEGKDH